VLLHGFADSEATAALTNFLRMKFANDYQGEGALSSEGNMGGMCCCLKLKLLNKTAYLFHSFCKNDNPETIS